MRLLVCGDRNWKNYPAILAVLASMSNEIKLVIEGEAKGADSMARIAARELGIEVLKYPADWNQHGKAAGPIRNTQMLQEGKPTHVIAFHDNLPSSKGTRNMIKQAVEAGLPVRLWTSNHGYCEFPVGCTLCRICCHPVCFIGNEWRHNYNGNYLCCCPDGKTEAEPDMPKIRRRF